MQRVVALFMCPQRSDGNNTVVDLADRTEILAGDMVGGAAILTVAGIVADERTVRCGGAISGSAPASAVNVLARSRGASKPAR